MPDDDIGRILDAIDKLGTRVRAIELRIAKADGAKGAVVGIAAVLGGGSLGTAYALAEFLLQLAS